jgi:hypothetical protein
MAWNRNDVVILAETSTLKLQGERRSQIAFDGFCPGLRAKDFERP